MRETEKEVWRNSAHFQVEYRLVLCIYLVDQNPSLMNIRKAHIFAIVMLSAFSVYPQKGHADKLTAETVLGWSNEKQDGYYTTSLSMAGVIAAQLERSKAACIDDLYEDAAQSDFSVLKQALEKYPTYHPQGIVLWVIQNECGKIGN